MQDNDFIDFLEVAHVDKFIGGNYLIYLEEYGCQGLWFEYNLKHKIVSDGCGISLSSKQLTLLHNTVEEKYHALLKTKSDIAAEYWGEYIDYEELYGLDNGWN